MNFYRTALAAFVIGNVILFTAYMRIASQPWEAALVFFGYVLTNMPIAVSVFTAAKIDKTLKGHWLNWLNMLIPIVVGTVGLVGYSTMALKPSAHPAIFYYGPCLSRQFGASCLRCWLWPTSSPQSILRAPQGKHPAQEQALDNRRANGCFWPKPAAQVIE